MPRLSLLAVLGVFVCVTLSAQAEPPEATDKASEKKKASGPTPSSAPRPSGTRLAKKSHRTTALLVL